MTGPMPLLAACALLTSALCAQEGGGRPAAEETTGFLAKTIAVGGTEHRYAVYVPRGYSPDRRWPLIMFLHGMGECGTDGRDQIRVGLGPAIQVATDRWPCIVVLPQKPDRASQWIDHDAMVMAMLAATEKAYAIEPARRYLTGLSQGGAGTWALGAAHSDVWAAIAPVCGYAFKPGDVASKLKDMPIWAFHGEADKTVPVSQSKALCAAVEAAGGKPLLSLFPKVGHNSWDKAYRDEALAEWLLAPPRERLGVWYFADEGRMQSVRITLRDEKDSDGGPPFHATTTVAFAWAGKGKEGTWRAARAHREPAGRDGPSPEPRTGTMPAREARAFAIARLQELRKAEVFALPETIEPKPPKGAVMAWNAYTLDVEIDGSGGPWRFQRFVPRFAQYDPRFELATGALRQAVAAIGELQ